MGHMCNVLTFDAKMKKEAIERECGKWADENCDRRENPRGYDSLSINFTSRVFENYLAACEYLDTTFGNYRQTAVQYKEYPEFAPTKAMQAVNAQIKKYSDLLGELNKPHYANPNIKSKTIKCKACESVLAIKYCGHSYRNNCPVCGADLRPTTVLDKEKAYNTKVEELRNKYRELERAEQKKLESKAVLKWAVACEVHC